MLRRRRRWPHTPHYRRRTMLAAGLLMKLRKRRRCSVTQGSGERSDSPLNGWPAEPQSPDDAAAAAAAASEDDEDERQGTSMVSSLSRLWSRASKRPQVRASASSRSSVTRPASVSSGVSQPSLVDIAIPPRPSTAGSGSQPAKRTLTLLPSVFAGRPPVVLFTYTTACGAKQRPLGRGVTVDDEALRLFYSHTDSVHQYNAVINVLRQGGLYRVKQETKRWHVLWSTHPSPDQLKCFGPLQRAKPLSGLFPLGPQGSPLAEHCKDAKALRKAVPDHTAGLHFAQGLPCLGSGSCSAA